MRILNNLTVSKNVKAFGLFQHPFRCKISKKIEGRTLWRYLKNFQKSHKAENGESLIVPKKIESGRDPSALEWFCISC